jgi:dCMP deaminase
MLKWDKHFIDMCRLHAGLSKDPTTKVGAVIVTPDRQVVSAGFNGFPRGIKDDDRLLDREVKLKLVVHAEMNAILAAANLGIRVRGCTMYVSALSGDISWGGICSSCAKMFIQAGLTKIITHNISKTPDRWKEEVEFAKSILIESGVEYEEIDYEN